MGFVFIWNLVGFKALAIASDGVAAVSSYVNSEFCRGSLFTCRRF